MRHFSSKEIFHSLHPDNIRISDTVLGWRGKRSEFSIETSPQDLAKSYLEYYSSHCDFETWVEKKERDINNFASEVEEQWKIIKRHVLETLYLFGDWTENFVEIYGRDKLPFDDLGKACVSVLQNPACEDDVSKILDILKEYEEPTRKILLQSIPLYCITWEDKDDSIIDGPAYLYGSIEKMKNFLKNEIKTYFNGIASSKEIEKEKNKALSSIATFDSSNIIFSFQKPELRFLCVRNDNAYDSMQAKLSNILKLIKCAVNPRPLGLWI